MKIIILRTYAPVAVKVDIGDYVPFMMIYFF